MVVVKNCLVSNSLSLKYLFGTQWYWSWHAALIHIDGAVFCYYWLVGARLERGDDVPTAETEWNKAAWPRPPRRCRPLCTWQIWCMCLHYHALFISSTPPSRPNNISGSQMSVRPQKVSSMLMKFGMKVEVNEWCMTVCSMTRSEVRSSSRAPESRKFNHFQGLSPPHL